MSAGKFKWCLTILTLVFLWGEVQAQVGVIRGEVKDEEGNPLQDVSIRIEGLDVKRNYKTKTDKRGKYFHGGVSLQGRYRVIAEKEGYQADYVEGVQPGFDASDERGEINFTLRKGQSGVLAFELTDEERERLQREAEEARKRQEALKAVQAELNEGVEFYNQGQYEQALEAFKKALEIDAKQPAVWGNLGATYNKLKRNQEAVEHYTKAIELDPQNATYYQNLGAVYSDMGDSAKAKEYFEKAAQIGAAQDPAKAAVSYYNMAVTYINTGKSLEAVEALEKALQFNPRYADAHYQLGVTLIGLNRLDEAVQHLKEYLRLDPTGENAEVAKALIEQLGQD